jgi:hypothetical protein
LKEEEEIQNILTVTARCYREAVDAHFNKTFTKEKS